MRLHFQLAILLLGFAMPASSQAHFTPGEVVVSSYTYGADPDRNPADVRVHNPDGSFSRELVVSISRRFREPLVLNDTAFVAARSPEGIARFRSDGTELPPLTTAVNAVNYLSPARNGGIFAANGSGEVYHFAANGTLLAFRNFTNHPGIDGGIDLAADGCTLFFATGPAIGRWNTCTNTPAEFIGADLHATLAALRLLPDGSFLVGAYFQEGPPRIIHVARDASTILRVYPFAANPLALALDVDGTSFWANPDQFLAKVDIATGAILSQTPAPLLIEGIAVVGEPRAALASSATSVPATSTTALVLLLLSIGIAACVRLRG